MALLPSYALEKHLEILVFSAEDTVQHKSAVNNGGRISLWLGQDVCLGFIPMLCKTAIHKQWYCHLTVLNTNQGSALKLIQMEKYCFFSTFFFESLFKPREVQCLVWHCWLQEVSLRFSSSLLKVWRKLQRGLHVPTFQNQHIVDVELLICANNYL